MLGDPSAHDAQGLEALARPERLRLGGSLAGAGRAARRGGLGPEGRRWPGAVGSLPGEPPGRAIDGRWLCPRRGAAGGGSADGDAVSTKASTSFLVTRPPRPLPSIVVGSIPCSAAILATTGETKLWAEAGAPSCSPVPTVGSAGSPSEARRLGVGGATGGRRVRLGLERGWPASAGSARPVPAGRAPDRRVQARGRRTVRRCVPAPRRRPPSRLRRRGSPAARRARGSAPRCRPCRSRSRAATRRPGPCRPRSAASA